MILFCLLNASFHNSKYLCGCGLSAKHLWKTSILIVGIDWDCVINGSTCPICSDTHSHITPHSPPHSQLWSPLHGKEVSRGDFFNQGVCLVHTRETKRRKLPSYANLQAFRKSQQKANSCTKLYENSLHRNKLMTLFYWNHYPRVNNTIASLSLD